MLFFGGAPAVGFSFGRSTEPSFALFGADLGLVVVSLVRHVVDFDALVVDVAFDVAAGLMRGAAI